MTALARFVPLFIFLSAGAPAGAQEAPLPPGEAPRHMKLPAGFQATLFAGEPDVVQPIAIAFDDRGRLWVAECLSYPDWKREGPGGEDSILIFEDQDGDGRFDSRKVFWDRGRNVSGLEIGFGGVWVCATPELLFIPDRDKDDVPDGPPSVLLDGWNLEAKHNVVNGLNWGPDGWLYGLHGILTTSLVGPPGTPKEKRTPLDCGVWRYHPTRRTFEVVAWGTTNPWGLDFDALGQIFITNCVIHHLWHVIPGAHFERMFGQDLNPNLYELMQSPADHLHWAGGPWQESRGGAAGRHGEAGGGHAHAGAMVYLGDNWPPQYRGALFTSNIHGSRVNMDLLERRGSGYLARHGPDFLHAGDPWFRGLSIQYGPDGGVFLTDWSDSGECHDYDHVHRSSGRIYKIVHGRPLLIRVDLAQKTGEELAALQLHRNDWHVHHARRLLQERSAAGRDLGAARRALLEIFRTNSDATRKLRALWALEAAGGLPEELLLEALDDPAEEIRSWAVRFLLEDGTPPGETMDRVVRRALHEPSGLVRLHLASALQRLPLEKRPPLARALAARPEDSGDRNLSLMIWYGIEPVVAADPAAARDLVAAARIPLVRRLAARRLALVEKGERSGIAFLAEVLERADDPELHRDVLQGMKEALKGRADVEVPAGWPMVHRKLSRSPAREVAEGALNLSGLFGIPEALAALREGAMDPSAAPTSRQKALSTLVERRDPQLPPLLYRLLAEGPPAGPEIRGAALRALAAFADPAVPPAILARYASFSEAEKADAVNTLSSRSSFAEALLEAVEGGRVPARDLSAFTVRQLRRLESPRIEEALGRVWGVVRPASKEKAERIAGFRRLLTPERLKDADRSKGRLLFERNCSSCHALFGSGKSTGPDLTGSQRQNLDYNLENLLDPSAIVGRDYQMTVLHTRDGRVITGIVKEEVEHTVTLQTVNDAVIVPHADIRLRTSLPVSMMPEDLLDRLAEDEVIDLVAYLSGPEQAPLPAGEAGGSGSGR